MTRTRTGSLSRKALAATLAGALALTTASVAPARADTNADAIAAAAFFGLIAAAIIATSRADAHRAPSPPSADPRKLLPADCRFTIRHGADSGAWYGRRCLVVKYAHWPLLPHRCERTVELPRAHYDITAFKARCLARFGYRSDAGGFSAHR